MPIVLTTNLPDLELVARGKVRDIYDLGKSLLIVTTDRISAFDVIMNEGIPDKGYVLTQISAFWFRQMEDIIPNHIISTEIKEFPAECRKYADVLEGRSMLVKKATPLPVECIVRGYISGSGWKDYKATGAICGHQTPEQALWNPTSWRSRSSLLPQRPSWGSMTKTSLSTDAWSLWEGKPRKDPRCYHCHLQARP